MELNEKKTDTPAEHPAASTPGASAHAPAASPVRKRGGANHVTHGMYGVGLPRGAQRLARRLNEFRRALCAAVEDAGSIDLTAAATIDSACQWLRHGLLAARWLRLHEEKMTHDQRLAYSREVAKASAERDRCIRLLRLDKPAFDPASIYDLPPITGSEIAATAAPEARVSDSAAPGSQEAMPANIACNSVLSAYNGDTLTGGGK